MIVGPVFIALTFVLMVMHHRQRRVIRELRVHRKIDRMEIVFYRDMERAAVAAASELHGRVLKMEAQERRRDEGDKP